ncbi:hypothetical protein Ddye_030662 [Dipteronia dyeriana]|uniref:Uncharacterized protein n=1 Tax=Dipteronia dyeriana TaxID=168575 RepID=A0AAD9TGT2_9ROSI|nr:hypothetical protein Ddye_030662 [Dipteronia dyeriana]
MLIHAYRLLGWWSIDEGSREEQARLYCAEAPGYNTFSPDIVRKMPKSDLVDEIWRLQAALSEQSEITKFSQEECERLQNVLLRNKLVFICVLFNLCSSIPFFRKSICSLLTYKFDESIRKRSYVEFVSKNRLTWSCFHAGITSCAGHAVRSVKSAPSAASSSKSDCQYTMFSLNSFISKKKKKQLGKL